MKIFCLNRYSVVILSFILLTLPGLQSCNEKDDEHETETSTEELITGIMNETQLELEAPGWAVGIQTSTVLYELAGGQADLAGGLDMLTTDYLRIGSITKTFTATLVLILCDEGILHLNDKLENYYPNFPVSDEITIRQLLKHTSGLVTWDENEDIRMQIYNGTSDWTIDKLIEWAETQDTLSGPGKEFHYSNIGYFLLGKIIEQASGMTVANLIQEKICQPLGLMNTFMAEEPYPPGDVIHGYDESSGEVLDMTGTPQADAINFELAWTSGGMFSSLEDLTIWCRSLANGDLLSDSLHEQQMPVLNPPSQALPYWSGYGMGVSQTSEWMGHTGAICGYVCNMQYNVAEDVSIVTFFNKFSAFDIDANTADLHATTENFMSLASLMCPGSLDPETIK